MRYFLRELWWDICDEWVLCVLVLIMVATIAALIAAGEAGYFATGQGCGR